MRSWREIVVRYPTWFIPLLWLAALPNGVETSIEDLIEAQAPENPSKKMMVAMVECAVPHVGSLPFQLDLGRQD